MSSRRLFTISLHHNCLSARVVFWIVEDPITTPRMGSIGILDWPRCSCGKSLWPLRMTSQDDILPQCWTCQLAHDPQAENNARRAFLRWHLLPHGYPAYFHRLTYFHNGMPGSISQTEDVFDRILSFVRWDGHRPSRSQRRHMDSIPEVKQTYK